MSSGPLVSVIICNYNYAAYVGQAIESVLHQTYPHYEIVVVDDGSTDQSAAVIDAYASRHPGCVRPIYTQNQGQASALRVGVLQSRGDVVCFLDSDDFFFEQKLDLVVTYMERFQADGLAHRVWMFGDAALHQHVYPQLGYTRAWPHYNRSGKLKWIHNRISIDDYGAFYTTNSGIVLRRELALAIAKYRSNEWRYKHYGDVYFDRPAQLLGRILFIPGLLAGYRIHHFSHHLHNLNVQGRQNLLLQQNLLAEKYAYVNSLLMHYGYPSIDLYRNLRWLDLAIRNGTISYKTYLVHCCRTRPPSRRRAVERIGATLQYIRQSL